LQAEDHYPSQGVLDEGELGQAFQRANQPTGMPIHAANLALMSMEMYSNRHYPVLALVVHRYLSDSGVVAARQHQVKLTSSD